MKKLSAKEISSAAYAAVFLLVTAVLGVMSFAGLISYYDTGTVKNNEWTVELGSKLEADIATAFYGKMSFVNFNGALRRVLGQQEMNGVVKLDNGYLLAAVGYKEDGALRNNADKVISMKNYFDEKGIGFLYVIPPYTSSKYDPRLPAGVHDYGNDNLDRLSAMLKEGGVGVLDIREAMHEDGIDAYGMMYKTDHHWTTRAGFYAYSKINDILTDRLGCAVDPEVMDFGNYTVAGYPRWHLGSNGQRTGAYFAGVDDFELILPAFETYVSHKTDEGAFDEGAFDEVVIRKDVLEKRNLASRYTYDGVLWKTFGEFKNDNAANDKKILMMTDSFGRAVIPYLILSYSRVMSIEGQIDYETVNEYNPDAVIVLDYVTSSMRGDRYKGCVGLN